MSQIWRKWKAEVIEKVRAASTMSTKRLSELLQTLLAIDKTLGEEAASPLLLNADTFFNTIFRITYYDDPDFSIKNTTDLAEILAPQSPVMEHSKILELISSQE